MRFTVCIGSLVFVMFTCGCGCGSFVASDKWNHFAFSASFSSIATAVTSEPAESVVFAVGLGLLKEICDGLRGSGFQMWDLVADMAGATAGGFVTAEICMEEFP
ncbi:MAG: hypothetical protein KAR40_03040 [Candidatus Sabulitectum sp.]|nr:hypothetical protein [Candidatus Sabulitectum sp.]